MYVADPFGVDVGHEYVLALSDPSASIDFDFYGVQTSYVSREFLAVCEKIGVRYRAIPISIVANKKFTDKKYSIFLPADHESLLDCKKSDYSEERDLETRKIVENKLFPGVPIYSWIKKFIPRDDYSRNLFRCEETMELVCSQEFKDEIERCALKGIVFCRSMRIIPMTLGVRRLSPFLSWRHDLDVGRCVSNVYGVGQDDAYRTLVQVDDTGEITYEASIATRAAAQFGQRLGGEYSPASLSWSTPRRKKDGDLQAMLPRFIIFSAKALGALAPLLQRREEILAVEAPCRWHGRIQCNQGA